MSSRGKHPRAQEIDRIAGLLQAAWAKAEPDHGVTLHPVSYIATFADMARAVVDDRYGPGSEPETRTRCPATSPGGSTDEGQLPRTGAQCGLDAGHDGEHSVLIASGSPWWPKPKEKTDG